MSLFDEMMEQLSLLEQENERLQTDNKRLLHNEKVYQDRIKQKDNTIKEVREYCKNRVQYFDDAKLENWNYSTDEEYSCENILEILDKEKV